MHSKVRSSALPYIGIQVAQYNKKLFFPQLLLCTCYDSLLLIKRVRGLANTA